MKNFTYILILLCLVGFNANAYEQGTHKVDSRRGNPGSYDPGPAKDSKWLELFGKAPKYRALGKYILTGKRSYEKGGEKFRWKFGPMFYRGRLGTNEVKALIVGQEGAQDENLSNRAFTGSTGTKTQNFLNHLGLTRSYLFLNTYVYTINGQRVTSFSLGEPKSPYTEETFTQADVDRYLWLEQGLDSPIVQYRHELFDNAVIENAATISLLMGVGGGGKESLATWVNARGGKCSTYKEMKNCDTSGVRKYFAKKGIQIKNQILVIGVPHPGGASPNNGGDGAYQRIVGGFTGSAQRVANFKKKNPQWLLTDEEEDAKNKKQAREKVLERMDKEYKYTNAPIPFKDFAFGTNWRMGEKGTTSNRRHSEGMNDENGKRLSSSRGIQIFSADGLYNNVQKKGTKVVKNHKVKYRPAKIPDIDSGFYVEDGKIVGLKGMVEGDVPYESPRFTSADSKHVQQYDYGPCGKAYECKLSRMLQSWPNFYNLDSDIKPISHESFGHGAIYRGRLNEAKVLVIADQQSHDDFFSTRALTGAVGQKLQTFLNISGAKGSYAILRTLPVDTMGLDLSDREFLALNPKVVRVRNKILDEVISLSGTKVIVTLGVVASMALEKYKVPHGIKVLHLGSVLSGSHIKNWNDIVKEVANQLGTRTQGTYKGQLTTIARQDMPIHTRWWMGSSGNRSSRGLNTLDDKDGDYYIVMVPEWAGRVKPTPLTEEEVKQIDENLQ